MQLFHVLHIPLHVSFPSSGHQLSRVLVLNPSFPLQNQLCTPTPTQVVYSFSLQDTLWTWYMHAHTCTCTYTMFTVYVYVFVSYTPYQLPHLDNYDHTLYK